MTPLVNGNEFHPINVTQTVKWNYFTDVFPLPFFAFGANLSQRWRLVAPPLFRYVSKACDRWVHKVSDISHFAFFGWIGALLLVGIFSVNTLLALFLLQNGVEQGIRMRFGTPLKNTSHLRECLLFLVPHYSAINSIFKFIRLGVYFRKAQFLLDKNDVSV